MAQTGKKARSYADQMCALTADLSDPETSYATACNLAQAHILEAEARGAEEQRRKGAEIAGYIPANTSNFFALSEAAHTSTAMHKKPFPGDVPVYYSANVAALEARVKVLEGERDALKKQIQAMNPGSARPVIHSPTRFMDDSRAALTREGGE